jgi:hypothetical protein
MRERALEFSKEFPLRVTCKNVERDDGCRNAVDGHHDAVV